MFLALGVDDETAQAAAGDERRMPRDVAGPLQECHPALVVSLSNHERARPSTRSGRAVSKDAILTTLAALREPGPQLRVDRASDPRHDLRQRLDVRPVGVEIHDAGAQHVAAADDGVRDERLAAALQPIEQLAVERVEMPLDRRLADAAIADRAARSGTS